MKILIASHVPTHPTNAGNRSCMVSYAQLLREMGHQVDFLYLHLPWATVGESLEPMRSWWGSGFHLFTQSGFDRFTQLVHHKFWFRLRQRYNLDAMLPFGAQRHLHNLVASEGYQAVIVNYWAFSGLLEGLGPGVKRVIYTHDNYGDRFQNTGGDWLSTNKQTESKAFDRAHVVLAIQEEEALDFGTRTQAKVLVSYSPFQLEPMAFTGKKNILYLASSNGNNVSGLRRFVSDVLPLLVARDPQIKLIVGGRVCQMVPDLAGCPGLELQGEFESLSGFYAQGDLVINPVFTGSGLKIKTFEAMAFGRTVVCDPHSVEGIYRSSSAPIRAAATPQEYLEIISELFSHPPMLLSACQQSLEYIRELNLEVRNVFEQAVAPDHSKRSL